MDNKITPFLMKKWKQAFKFFDITKDGEINADDLAQFGDYISRKTVASAHDAAKTREEWVKWVTFLKPDPGVVMNEEVFLKGAATLFTEDLENHIRQNRLSSSDLFDRIDLNNDGQISIEELSLCYEAVGITDKGKIQKAFDSLDKDGDGMIDREEFIEDYIRHFTNPDPIAGQSYFISSVME